MRISISLYFFYVLALTFVMHSCKGIHSHHNMLPVYTYMNENSYNDVCGRIMDSTSTVLSHPRINRELDSFLLTQYSYVYERARPMNSEDTLYVQLMIFAGLCKYNAGIIDESLEAAIFKIEILKD